MRFVNALVLNGTGCMLNLFRLNCSCPYPHLEQCLYCTSSLCSQTFGKFMTHSVLNKDFFCGETVCATPYVEGYVLTNAKSETVMQPYYRTGYPPFFLSTHSLGGFWLYLKIIKADYVSK